MKTYFSDIGSLLVTFCCVVFVILSMPRRALNTASKLFSLFVFTLVVALFFYFRSSYAMEQQLNLSKVVTLKKEEHRVENELSVIRKKLPFNWINFSWYKDGYIKNYDVRIFLKNGDDYSPAWGEFLFSTKTQAFEVESAGFDWPHRKSELTLDYFLKGEGASFFGTFLEIVKNMDGEKRLDFRLIEYGKGEREWDYAFIGRHIWIMGGYVDHRKKLHPIFFDGENIVEEVVRRIIGKSPK